MARGDIIRKGDFPLKDGTLQQNLNADKLDGYSSEMFVLTTGANVYTADQTIDKNTPRFDLKSDLSGTGVAGRLEANENGNLWLNVMGGKQLWLNWLAPSGTAKTDLRVGDGQSGTTILSVLGDTRTVQVDGTLNTGTVNTGDVFVGGTTNKRLVTRHIDGKSTTTTAYDHLYISHYSSLNTLINANGGKVGIGTTAPIGKFTVDGNFDSRIAKFIGGDIGGNGWVEVFTPTDGKRSGIIFGNSVDGWQGQIEYDDADGSLNLWNKASKRFTIDSSGAVRIVSDIYASQFYGAVRGRLVSEDTRSTNYSPEARDRGLYVDFRANTADGLADGSTYHGVMTFRPYGGGTDMSGGYPYQLGFTENGNLWIRKGTSLTAWSSWQKFWHSGNADNPSDKVNKAGDTMTGNLTMGNNSIYGDITANYLNLGATPTLATVRSLTIHADADDSSTTEYLSLKAGSDDLRITSNGTITFNGNTVWHSGNDGRFIRSDADDTFTGLLTASSTNRQSGIYGTYDSTKIDHIWSMGTAYKIDTGGLNFGNLYGLAYKHTNNSTGGVMAGGHQMVWASNGVPKSAMGDGGFWTDQSYRMGGSGNSYSTINYDTGAGQLNVNSFGDVLVNIDSNNNETNRIFAVTSNNVTTTHLFKVDEVGNTTVTGKVYANNGIKFDRNDIAIDFGDNVYIGTLAGGTTAEKAIAIRGTNQIRFSDSEAWSWNDWAGMMYEQLTGNLVIGSAHSSYFTSGGTTGNLKYANIIFDGVNDVSIRTQYGYVDIGAKNTSYAHFYTDRPSYYFDKPIQSGGDVIGSYGTTLNLQTGMNGNTGTTRMSISSYGAYIPTGSSYYIGSTGGVGTESKLRLHHSSNNSFIDFGTSSLYIRGASNATHMSMDYNSGNTTFSGNIMANGGVSFSDTTGFWLKTASTWGLYWDTASNELQFRGANNIRHKFDLDTGFTWIGADLETSGHVSLNGSNGRGLRFWNSDLYKIFMSTSSDSSWGGNVPWISNGDGTGLDFVTDYNMYFRMESNNRGWAFRNDEAGGVNAQIEGNGRFHSKKGYRADKFSMEYNATEDSLDFVYNG